MEGKYCGSQYGYRLHRKNGARVCESCRLAMNAVNAASRLRDPEKERSRHIAYRARVKAEKDGT